jgi:heavy metal sensor kinase
MRLPIRTRLTLVFAGLAFALVAIAGLVLLLAFRAQLRTTVEEGLIDRAGRIVEAGDPAAAVGAVGRTDEAFAQLLDASGTRVLAESIGLPPEPLPIRPGVRGGTPGFLDARVSTTEEPVDARLYGARLADGSILVIGQDIEDQRDAVARLGSLIAIGAPLVLAMFAFLGWVLAGGALRPVERLRAEAAAISTLEPSRRLAVPATGDEIQRLAETVNGMLDRLQEALDGERRFLDEASHELRTPLGVLRGEVELALRGGRSREELEAALRSIRQEADRLTRLTQDLLVLARTDRGRLPVHRSETDIGALLERVASEFSARAAAAGVRLAADADGVTARVDPDRIRQAVENLVDNALRQVPAGGEVRVRAIQRGSELRLSVEDTGPGFADAVLPRAFERFSRDDADRDGDGAGLGLAIVRAIAEAHGGRATAENAPHGGATVAIVLPA